MYPGSVPRRPIRLVWSNRNEPIRAERLLLQTAFSQNATGTGSVVSQCARKPETATDGDVEVEGFNSSPAELTQASGLVISAHDEVNGQMKALRNNLESLRGVWQGQAYNNFAQLMVRWDTNAKTVSDALMSIGDALKSSGAAYQAQEDQEASGMSAISNALTS